jgi:hypothetical protein
MEEKYDVADNGEENHLGGDNHNNNHVIDQ